MPAWLVAAATGSARIASGAGIESIENIVVIYGWRMRGAGSQSLASFVIRSHVPNRPSGFVPKETWERVRFRLDFAMRHTNHSER